MKRSIFALITMLMIAPIAKAEYGSNFDSNEPVLGLNLKSNSNQNIKDSVIKLTLDESVDKLSGIVSWYADKFHGKKTSSGELYDKNNLTAAHRTLPFGTKVRVTNPKNNKSVIVTINDRGPHSKARILDLSKAAFTAIGSIDAGILKVELDVLD